MGYKEAAAIFHNLMPDGERLSGTDKTVLMALAFLSFTVGSSRSSLDTISRHTGLNERTVRRCIERLKKENLLAESPRFGASSVRRVVLPAEWYQSKGSKSNQFGHSVQTESDTVSELATEESGQAIAGSDTVSAPTGHDGHSARAQCPLRPGTESTYGVLVGNEDEIQGGAREAREEPHPESHPGGGLHEERRDPDRVPDSFADWCDPPTWRTACELALSIESAPCLHGEVEVVDRGGVKRAASLAMLLIDAGKHVAIDRLQVARTVKCVGGGSWRGATAEDSATLADIRNALRRYPDGAYPSSTNRTAAGGRGASRIEHACRILGFKPTDKLALGVAALK